MRRMFSDDIYQNQIESDRQSSEMALKRRQIQMDEMLKKAQLAEMGYNVKQGQGLFGGGQMTMTRDPLFVSNSALERQKLSTENQMNQMKLERMQRVNGGGALFGSGSTGIPQGMTSYIDPNTGEEKIVKDPNYVNPNKPLSDAQNRTLGMAEQALGQIGEIRKLAQPTTFGNLKKGYSKIRFGQKLGVTDPTSIKGAILNTATYGLAKLPFKTTDDEKKFELAVNLIAENNLRFKTGATAPTEEQIREEARQLVGDDSYESFLHRMGVSEDYARGLAERSKPGSTAKFGQQPEAAVPEWAAADPEAYSDAVQSGQFSEEQIKDWFVRNGLLKP